jgi:hypothetical protein
MTITVQHTIFYNKCNSASLECSFNIQQSPETMPQPPPPLPPSQNIGKFEGQRRNVKF